MNAIASPDLATAAPAPSEPLPGIVSAPVASLAAAVAAAARCGDYKSTIPVLRHVLISADGDGLSVRGTDLDMLATIRTAGSCEGGSFALPGKDLAAILKRVPAESVRIETTWTSLPARKDSAGNVVRPISGLARLTFASGTVATLPALPPTDWPAWTMKEPEADHELPAGEFREALDGTSFAISTEETRYYLNGTFVHGWQERGDGPLRLRLVATDGHKLACATLGTEVTRETFPGGIVPRLAVAEMVRAIPKGKKAPASVRFGMSHNAARLIVGDVTIRTRLIDGTFPDYARVMPYGNPGLLTFDRADMVAAIEQVSPVLGKNDRAVRFDLSATRIDVRANGGPDSGDAVATAAIAGAYAVPENHKADRGKPGERYSPELTIGFNWRYLTGILDRLPAGDVVARTADFGSPTMFYASGQADRLTFVLMPMRVA